MVAKRRCQSTHRLSVQRTRAANSTPRCWFLGAQRMRTECNAEASMNHRTMEDRMSKAKPWGRRLRLWMCLALLQCSVTSVASAQQASHDHAHSAAAKSSEELPPAPERSIEHGRVVTDISAADDDVHAAYERPMQLYTPAVNALARTIRDIVDAERSEEHTSELQSRGHLVCRLLLEN